MSHIPAVEFTVYPDDCDAYGHLNQAALVRIFERARWEALAAGPGADVFTRNNTWPAIRKTTVEYRAQAHSGDVLGLEIALIHHGHTSFTLRQIARNRDGIIVAEGEFVLVCIDTGGRPVPVPADVSRFFGARPSMLPGSTRQLQIGDVSLAVDSMGDGDAVLFLHAFPLDRTTWKQVAATLTGWRRINPDLRGFGLSDVPDDGYGMSVYADDLAALLDRLGVERAVVCGLSMGGYIAFEMMRRHRDRVRALVLANTRAGPDDAAGRAARDAMIAKVRRDGVTAIVDGMIPRLLGPTSLATMPDVVEQVRRTMHSAPPDGVIGAVGAMRDREDSRALLETIDVPTLVIAGREDQLIPVSESKMMAAAIAKAHMTIVPAAGHLAPLEQPINTGRIIGEFLEALR